MFPHWIHWDGAILSLLIVMIYNLLFVLEGLAPYGGQTSSSRRGLVAFSHQMGALWAPLLVKLKFGALCAPPYSSPGELVAFGHLIGALFVYRFVCLFVFSLWDTHECFPKSFVKIQIDLAGSKTMFICLFVCLFVYGFVWFFCFNHCGTPIGSFPESFIIIRLDLADILRIYVLIFLCLFLC